MLSAQIGKWILDGVQLLVLFLLSVGSVYAKKWLKAHVSAKEAEKIKAEAQALAVLARKAVPLVARLLPNADGATKMSKAIALVNSWVEGKLHVSVQEIEAALEDAWAEAKGLGLLNIYEPQKTEPSKDAPETATK